MYYVSVAFLMDYGACNTKITILHNIHSIKFAISLHNVI